MTLQEMLDEVTIAIEPLVAHAPRVGLALGAIFIAGMIAKFASRGIVNIVARSRMRRSLQVLLSKLVGAILWTIGLLVCVTIAFPGITPAKLFTVLGLGSVAIGYAFKEVFENFMAGIVILVRDVIEIGDVIHIGGETGRVEAISMRDTHIRAMDGRRIVLPNAKLFRDAVEVLTDGQNRRADIEVGVAYGTDLELAKDVIETALDECESVRNDYPCEVLARRFGASSIDLEVCWWTGSKPREIRSSRDEVVRRIARALADAGIEIPFPQRTLHLPDGALDLTCASVGPAHAD